MAMQQTLEQKNGKSAVKQIFTALIVAFALIIVAGYLFIRLQFEPSLFRQPFYHLSHHVLSVQDIGNSYPSREVAVTLTTSEHSNAKDEVLHVFRPLRLTHYKMGRSLFDEFFRMKQHISSIKKVRRAALLLRPFRGLTVEQKMPKLE